MKVRQLELITSMNPVPLSHVEICWNVLKCVEICWHVLKCVEIKIYSYFNISVLGLKVGVWRTFQGSHFATPSWLIIETPKASVILWPLWTNQSNNSDWRPRAPNFAWLLLVLLVHARNIAVLNKTNLWFRGGRYKPNGDTINGPGVV